MLHELQEVFSIGPGLMNLAEHDFELNENKPVRFRQYRISVRQNEILKGQIQRMLKMNIIKEGESDFNSPMILVKDCGKEPRLCIKCRKLNSITKAEIFSLPNIEDRV